MSWNNNSNDKPKKVCGAKTSQIKKGDHQGDICVTGWRSTRGGLVTVLCVPTSNTKEVSSKTNGRKWLTYMAIVKCKDTMQQTKYSCFYDPSSHKVMIPDLDAVVKPNARRNVPGAKGYFGPVE